MPKKLAFDVYKGYMDKMKGEAGVADATKESTDQPMDAAATAQAAGPAAGGAAPAAPAPAAGGAPSSPAPAAA